MFTRMIIRIVSGFPMGRTRWTDRGGDVDPGRTAGVSSPPPPDEADEIDALYRFLQQMRGQATLDDDFSMLKISFD